MSILDWFFPASGSTAGRVAANAAGDAQAEAAGHQPGDIRTMREEPLVPVSPYASFQGESGGQRRVQVTPEQAASGLYYNPDAFYLGQDPAYARNIEQQFRDVGAAGQASMNDVGNMALETGMYDRGNLYQAGANAATAGGILGGNIANEGMARADVLSSLSGQQGQQLTDYAQQAAAGLASTGANQGALVRKTGANLGNKLMGQGDVDREALMAQGGLAGDQLAAIGMNNRNSIVGQGAAGQGAMIDYAAAASKELGQQGLSANQTMAEMAAADRTALAKQAAQAQGALTGTGVRDRAMLVGEGVGARDIGQAELAAASGRAGDLTGLEATEGPSAAQAQLQSATNRGMSQNLAMAASGRGFGGGASARSQAMVQNAAMAQEAANQSAQLRAQETAAWRARQAANIGNAANISAGIGQQQTGLGAQQMQAGVQAGQQAQNAGYQLGQTGLQASTQAGQQGTQAGLGFAERGLTTGAQVGQQGLQAGYGLGQQANVAGANALESATTSGLGMAQQGAIAGVQAGQQAQQAGANTYMSGVTQGTDLAYRGAEAGAQLGTQGTQAGGQMRVQGYGDATNQLLGAMGTGANVVQTGQQQALGAVSQAGNLGQATVNNARDAYQQGVSNQMAGMQAGANIQTTQSQMNMQQYDEVLRRWAAEQGISVQAAQQQLQLLGAGIGAAGTLGAGLIMSDERAKADIEPTEGAAAEALAKARPSKFRYKGDESLRTVFGVMAQGLEETEAGQSVVEEHDGWKMLNVPKLTALTAAGVGDLAAQIEALKRDMAKLKERRAR